MRVLIVIVNYRSASLAIDSLRSLAPEIAAMGGPSVARAVVTDNASGDDSVERLTRAVRENHWGDWATIQPLARNGGFAYGNNEAIRPALASPDAPDYVLLLNPDTLVRPGAIAALTEFMDAHPDPGIAGSRLEDPDGTPQRSAFRFHTVFSELEAGLRLGVVSKALRRYVVAPPVPQGGEPLKVDWVAGASMIVRRAVFDAVGLMDEAYFMYFEEVDFCLRAARNGWPCWYVPASRVVHLVGQSSGVTDTKRVTKRRPKYWFDSRRRYFLVNHGAVKTVLADLAWALGFATFRTRQFLQRKPDRDPARLLRDFVRNSFVVSGR
jgi:hypothetical protein